MIKLHNTRTKKVDELQPLRSDAVTIYSCGPTVYDHVHIGNLSSFVYADTLRRVIEANGLATHHVMNFTDVDDKTIKRSQAEFHDETQPMQALQLVTERYSRMFIDDMQAIGNDTAKLTFVKATEHIEAMQELIRQLVAGGFAYIADDGVYFSIEAYRKSGKTYGQLLDLSEASTAEARINNDEYDKDSAHDFSLWKRRKDGEPYWPFVIDDQSLDGRPGWHIECSAMSEAVLGLPFDIHTGGIDLIFPHHENEIAQSSALRSEPIMANVFFHNEHLLVDGKKMSKSLGNFHTLDALTSRGIDPLAFRLATLQSHYRSQSNFTFEGLEAAQNYLQRLRAIADLRFQTVDVPSWLQLDELEQSILSPLNDDLRTPLALASLSAFVTSAEDKLISKVDEQVFLNLLGFLDNVLGFKLLERQDITSAQKDMITQRSQARDQQDWTASDKIRDDLLASGITVRDTPHGTIWARI